MADENITEDEVWEDLDRLLSKPERQAGDIDVEQFAMRYNMSETAARRKMKKLSNGQGWEYIIVHDDTSSTGMRRVLRKKK